MTKLNFMNTAFNDAGAEKSAKNGSEGIGAPNTEKSSAFKNEITAQYKKAVQSYAMNFERMGKMPPIQKLLQDDAHKVVKGRSMIEFAMDSLAIGFADTFKNLDDSKLPVDLYQDILKFREGKPVSEQDAANDLKKRIAHARTLKGANPENKDLLTVLIEPLGPQQTAMLVNLRSTILNLAANALLPKEMMDTLENLKESTNMVAKEFNKHAQKQGGSAPQKNIPGMGGPANDDRGHIDLDLGGKTKKKGSGNTNKADDNDLGGRKPGIKGLRF